MTDQTPGTPEERIASLRAEIEQAKAEVVALTEQDAASKEIVALNPGAVPAEVTRAKMAQARGRALKQMQEVQGLQERLRHELEAQAAAAKAEMEALLAPLRAQMQQMAEGILTVDLYLGTDEEIVPLTDVENLDPAPADTPFVLRQDVLSMDEETAAHAEGGGIDARNIDVFDEWIARPENLARVLPEQKGVVGLVPRRRGREYADPWVNVRLNEENRWTYFLLRSGGRVWRMRTEFVVGKRLIPAVDEFTGLFVKTRWDHATREDVSEPLVPGTKEWEAAEAAQSAEHRHYMRMALILQGLIDRTTLFQPLPDGGLNLLDARTYEEGRAVLLRDAEALLTDGRPEFKEWLAAKMADLRPGMRVMGAFNTKTFRDAGDESEGSSSDNWRYRPHSRITPRASSSYQADKPETGVLYRLEGKRSSGGVNGFYFRFARTRQRYMGSGYDSEMRAPKTKGSCLIAPGDQFVLPFDLITAEECRYYLASRRNRTAYEEMFPLLKATIEAKEAEAAEEAPFRTLLAGELVKADADLSSLDEAHTVLDDLVGWWKFKSKHHRALVGEPEHEARAIREIVTEYLARKGVEATQTPEARAERAMVARLLAEDPTIMVIGRKRDGGYLAFAPQPRTYPAGKVGYPATNVVQPLGPTEEEKAANSALHPVRRVDEQTLAHQNSISAAVADNVWAVEYVTGKTGRSIKKRDWTQPGTRLDAARILHATEAWEGWDTHAAANEHLTDPEIDALIAEIVPEFETHATAGWPTTRRINGDDTAPFVPLVLGICLRPGARSAEEPASIEIHFIGEDDPDALAEVPSARAGNTIESKYGKVRAPFAKTRDGVKVRRLTDDDRYAAAPWTLRFERSTYTSATDARPWHYCWDGRAKDAIALVEFPDHQAIATERAARIKAHNAVVSDRREAAREPLRHAVRAGNAAKEAEVYAQFLADYADPSLWEGHKKALRPGALEISMHPHGRDVPDALWQALRWFIDEGRSLDGYTIETAVIEAGLSTEGIDESLLSLPLWVEPEPDEAVAEIDEAVAEIDEAETDDAEDDPGYVFDTDGMRIADDGTVVISADSFTVTDEARPAGSSHLPVIRDEPGE